MEQIINYINQSKELIAAVVALILIVIAAYKQIVAQINAKTEVTNQVKGLIVDADENVSALKETLVLPLPTLPLLRDAKADEKRTVVVGAVMEKVKPNLLKKLGLTDPTKVASFVANIYQGIKVFLPKRK